MKNKNDYIKSEEFLKKSVDFLVGMNEYLNKRSKKYEKIVRYIANHEVEIVEKIMRDGKITIKLEDMD